MNEAIIFNFTVGLFIGGIIGTILMGLLGARRYDNMNREIQDLRTQRKLLKDELLKGQLKPKPRNRRISTYRNKYRNKRKGRNV
jgi:gas vesicle protein|tara:strand:+ start:585 stop:836 length:252 start_codon:yes stop_codon:yes gene_type:complete